MTNSERIQANNEELREAIEMAENLPAAGGGGSSVQTDWNQMDETAPDFLKNKPFWDMLTGGNTLYWDGNTDGLVNQLDTFYKVSDSIVSMDDLANGCTVVQDGYTENLPVDAIMELVSGIITTAISSVWFVAEQGVGVDLGDGLIFTESGVYFMAVNGGYVSSLTIPGYTGFPVTKKMDEKYLPGAVILYGDGSTDNPLLYFTKDFTEESNRVTKEQLIFLFNSGRITYIDLQLGPTHYRMPAIAIITDDSVGHATAWLAVPLSGTLVPVACYTAEYVPEE